MRVLIFGDSITQGFWDTEGGWVQRIRHDYDKKAVQNITDQYFATFFNLGISGDKSDSILQRMQADIETRVWHNEELILVFAIGINAYLKNGKPYSSIEKFNSDIKEIVKVAKKYSNKIMFVGLTSCDESRTKPVFWDNVVWENERLQQFDVELEKTCEQQDVIFVSIFEKFQREQKKRNLLEDGIHPNNDGHQFMAEIIQLKLDKLLHVNNN